MSMMKTILLAGFVAAGATAAGAATVTEATTELEGSFNVGTGVSTGTGISVNGFLFDPVSITGGSGDGNCSLFGGKCIQFNPGAFTLMTTDPPGGEFDLDALSFVLDGTPSELSVLNFSTDASGALIVNVDVEGGSCDDGVSICVEKNKWYHLLFEGDADGVTAIKFDNTGAGNMRIGAIEATLAPVPLPGTAMLLLGGIAGFGALRRRKRG